MNMMSDKKFKYWKKIYFLVGESFHYKVWENIENDGYAGRLHHGHPDEIDSLENIIEHGMSDNYFKFTDIFLRRVEEDI